MNAQAQQLIRALHNVPHRMVLAFAGGGASAATDLLAVPGGSRTILEVIVPYGEQALIDFLGQRPEQYCSEAVTQMLAQRAFERACWLTSAGQTGDQVMNVGLGCTASLVSTRPKRGEHRLFVHWRNETASQEYSLVLQKGARDRDAEEALVAAVVLNTLAEGCGLTERIELALLPGEQMESKSSSKPATTRLVHPDGQIQPASSWDATRPTAILPGSFNPLHEGHWKLAAAATQLSNLPISFELSVDNVDKPRLEDAEIRRRASQFAWRAPLWLTYSAATFLQKARLFPGAVFVVGADTAERIIAPRYYADGDTGVLTALAEIERLGCRFLVGGRNANAGNFLTLDDLCIPEGFRGLFSGIAREQFEANISSTSLRRLASQ